jgi:hypothetical protein
VLGGGIGSKVAADEIKAWCPTIAKRIMRSAARRLALDQGERYSEEWSSDLAQIPGAVSKVIYALDLHRAALGINRNQRRLRRQEERKMQGFETLATRLVLFPLFFCAKVSRVCELRLSKQPATHRPIDIMRASDIKEMIIRPWEHDEILTNLIRDRGYAD